MADSVTLYLVRHGVAAERGPEYPDDSIRPLTEDGIRRLAQSAEGLRALDVRFDEILTSPFTRARQTAEVIARAYPRPPRVTDLSALASGGPPGPVIASLEAFARCRSLALVGHEPDMGLLAARLTGARRPLSFKKGAVCCIEVDALPPRGPGDLRWFLPPRVLRRLGVQR